jgi:signal peptidase I
MRRFAGTAVLVVLVAVWCLTLRPAMLGGPAAYVVVSGQSMLPALDPGAFVVARRQASYSLGDVIVYRVPKGQPGEGTRVIHRIVGGSAAMGFRTRGDNRDAPDRWRPRPHDIEGVKLVAVPSAGRAMLLLGSPLAIGGLVAILAFVATGDAVRPRRRRLIDDVIAARPAPPEPALAAMVAEPAAPEPEPAPGLLPVAIGAVLTAVVVATSLRR